MPLAACKTCSHEISTEARSCPHCGAPTRRRRRWWAWVLWPMLGVAGVLTLGAIHGQDPVYQEKRRAQVQFEHCVNELNDPLTSSSRREAVRSYCAALRDSYVKRYGSEP